MGRGGGVGVGVMRMRRGEVIGGAGRDRERGRGREMEGDIRIPDDDRDHEATIVGAREMGIDTLASAERGATRHRGDGGMGPGIKAMIDEDEV